MQSESGTTFDSVLLNRFIQMVESGKADIAINADTQADDMYRIWASCMESVTESTAQ